MHERVADVLALLDALGSERAPLAGHDGGGAVAWHVAARHPLRFISFTSVSTPHRLRAVGGARGGGPQAQISTYIRPFQQPGAAEDALLAQGSAYLQSFCRATPDPQALIEGPDRSIPLAGVDHWLPEEAHCTLTELLL